MTDYPPIRICPACGVRPLREGEDLCWRCKGEVDKLGQTVVPYHLPRG